MSFYTMHSNPIAMRRLILLLLLVSLSFAACPTAIRTINVPAVLGESEGKLLKIEVSTRPGTGVIYTSIEPNIGITTQVSQQTAARYAFKAANMDITECDITYRVLGSPSRQLVEGPSAGLAMAVAAFAAIKGQQIRADVAVTGTIEQDGSVGAVGGLVEKASAASESGMKILISPKQELYEHLVLARLIEKTNITIVEAVRLVDALQIVFEPEGTKATSKFTLPKNELPYLLAAKTDSELEKFRAIASSLIEKDERTLAQIPSNGPDSAEIRNYFENELANYKKLLSLNYFFTVANSAFLLGADIEFFSTDLQNPDLEGRVARAQSCLLSASPVQPNSKNLEWVAAAQLRRSWAEKKLNETLLAPPEGSEQTAAAVRNLMFVQNWCEISKLFDASARESEGTPIPATSLEESAAASILRAQGALAERDGGSQDSQWHLSAARDMYAKGEYMGAIFDSAYAYTMETAAGELEANATVPDYKLVNADYSSLWAKIYRDHGAYLLADSGPDQSGYRILRFAAELEDAVSKISSRPGAAGSQPEIPSLGRSESIYANTGTISGPRIFVPVISVVGRDLDSLGALLYFIIVALGFMIFYRTLKR